MLFVAYEYSFKWFFLTCKWNSMFNTKILAICFYTRAIFCRSVISTRLYFAKGCCPLFVYRCNDYCLDVWTMCGIFEKHHTKKVMMTFLPLYIFLWRRVWCFFMGECLWIPVFKSYWCKSYYSRCCFSIVWCYCNR